MLLASRKTLAHESVVYPHKNGNSIKTRGRFCVNKVYLNKEEHFGFFQPEAIDSDPDWFQVKNTRPTDAKFLYHVVICFLFQCFIVHGCSPCDRRAFPHVTFSFFSENDCGVLENFAQRYVFCCFCPFCVIIGCEQKSLNF